LSSRWRRLRNFSGELGEVARVFPIVRINRRKGGARDPPGGPHHPQAWPRGCAW
jgi:hypothetical protein